MVGWVEDMQANGGLVPSSVICWVRAMGEAVASIDLSFASLLLKGKRAECEMSVRSPGGGAYGYYMWNELKADFSGA